MRFRWWLGLVPLLAELRAQNPLLALTDGQARDAAYHGRRPCANFPFTGEEPNGVVVFIEKPERKALNSLVEVPTRLASLLRSHLEKEVLAPAGLALGKRPLVLWLMKD